MLQQGSEFIYGIILTFFNRDSYGQPLMGIPIAQLVKWYEVEVLLVAQVRLLDRIFTIDKWVQIANHMTKFQPRPKLKARLSYSLTFSQGAGSSKYVKLKQLRTPDDPSD